MIYVIYGLEKFLVDEQIKRIIKENNIEELSISKFNAKIDDIDNIFLAASQMSLFGTTRLILIEESFFFTPNSGDEIILNKVYNFLNDYKGNNIVIFSFNSENPYGCVTNFIMWCTKDKTSEDISGVENFSDGKFLTTVNPDAPIVTVNGLKKSFTEPCD